MRQPVDEERVRRFMKALGREADREARLYFTGGVTAVLLGWRASTIDIDVKAEPESDRLMRGLAKLKDALQVNIELAAPDHFIPPLPGWEERSRFIGREGHLSFFHYDLYAQALAKIERGHLQDREDVRQMVEAGLVEPQELLRRFEQIEDQLHRYPAIDAPSFRRAVEEVVGRGAV